MKKLLFSLFAIALLIACSKDPNNSQLPIARGQLCEVLMVVDTSLWRSPLGDTLKSVFASDYPGLPQDEPYFNLRVVSPLLLNGLLKQSRNIIFVTTLDNKSAGNRSLLNNFTSNSIEKIQSDKSTFFFTKRDDFARGQVVLHLFGNNSQELLENLAKNKEGLRGIFIKTERERLSRKLFNNAEQRLVTDQIEQEFNFSIRVPAGFKMADKQKDFFWLRHPEKEVDRNIFVASKGYTSENDFTLESILAWRNEITKQYIFGDPERPDSYLVLQKYMVPETRVLNLDNRYTVEVRGLWQTNNVSMGGPFVSYVTIDSQAKKIYYVEGFVYAPGKDKRDYMMEMETILLTFKEKDQNPA